MIITAQFYSMFMSNPSYKNIVNFIELKKKTLIPMRWYKEVGPLGGD